MLKTVIKIAVVVLLIKELWLLLQIPSVADAIFAFVMVGQVPGTETTLSPDQMIWFLAGVFVLVSSLIFRKELVGLFRVVLKRDQPLEEAVAIEPVVPAAPEKVMTKKKEPKAPGRLRALIVRIKLGVASALGRLAPLLAAALVQVRRIFAAIIAFVGKAAIYTWKVALVTYILVSALAIAGWQWLRPRLEKFDRWLDRKLHQNEHTAAILAICNDMQRSVAKWWADFKAVDDLEPPQK